MPHSESGVCSVKRRCVLVWRSRAPALARGVEGPVAARADGFPQHFKPPRSQEKLKAKSSQGPSCA